MLLITEDIDEQSLDIICEAAEGKPKTYKIKGPFMVSEVKNKNGRIYSRELIEREVDVYTKQKINTKRALGQLSHPETPEIELENVSHIIESLKMEGNVAVGVATILNTPKGKIAYSLLESGVKLGVSSRGVGTLKGNLVEDSYKLIAVDIVNEPSGEGCFVDGILEGKEWIIDGNQVVAKAVEKLEENLAKHGSRDILRDLQSFLRDIHW
jgi:hypothetical protein